MPRNARHVLLAAVLLVAGPVSVNAEEESNWKRLESMPREQRVYLSERLEQFEALPSDNRTGIRALDAEIAKLDPLVQARYRAVLRRYHVWLSGLTDAQKTQLASVESLDAKLALVDKWRKAERLANNRPKLLADLGVYPGDLGTIPPFEMANALKAWFQLDPKERARIEALTPGRPRIAELIRVGAVKGIKRTRFPLAEEEALVKRIEANESVKHVFPNYYRKMDESKAKRVGMNNPLHTLAESLYFIDHPPAPVALAHLVQFEADLPSWFRASLDPLPPEDARRRLAILYRQIYEPPAEIHPPKGPGVSKTAERAKPAVAKPSGTAVEF